MNRKHKIALAASLAVLATATGCSGYNNARGRGDAPVGTVDNSGAQILQFPDRFANVATKCDEHGHRLFVTTRGDNRPAQLVVLADASCPGGAGPR